MAERSGNVRQKITKHQLSKEDTDEAKRLFAAKEEANAAFETFLEERHAAFALPTHNPPHVNVGFNPWIGLITVVEQVFEPEGRSDPKSA